MDEDDDEPVPLPNVNAAILKKVISRLSLNLCVLSHNVHMHGLNAC